MLYALMVAIREHYPDFEAKPCVDTVPISDRAWAVRAGLGWRGRNTLLVNPVLGSYCYIGELVSTSEADQYDTPLENGCGDCHRCVEACPNRCLVPTKDGSYWNDARRCSTAPEFSLTPISSFPDETLCNRQRAEHNCVNTHHINITMFLIYCQGIGLLIVFKSR